MAISSGIQIHVFMNDKTYLILCKFKIVVIVFCFIHFSLHFLQVFFFVVVVVLHYVFLGK